MLSFFFWYFAVVLLGWLAIPIGYRILRFLPDRAVGLSKPLGLLLWGFIFWLPASIHLFSNDSGGILLSLLVLAGLSWLAGRGRWGEIRSWLRSSWRVWLTAEVLFFLAFALWAAMRAAAPDATGTEKPMELAFINAILNSPNFPPHDPWLSGYAISYYYFGYVMVALLAKLTGIAGSVAFNLGVASWFGMAASAGYGVFYNILEANFFLNNRHSNVRGRSSYLTALLAPLFILLVGNFGGLLEAMHGAGLFWQPASAPQAVRAEEFPPTPACLSSPNVSLDSGFWRSLDIQELNCPPVEPYQFAPNRPGWWWWRSSRILTDYDLKNSPREVIDEFPAFSFLLGDLHPHVLSIPFVLLAVVLALNLYLRVLQERMGGMGWDEWLREPEFWLAGVTLGGLAFLNIWDFPIYLALYTAAFGMGRLFITGRWAWSHLGEVFRLACLLGLLGVLFYLPFYIGFASQAGGIEPSLSFFTRGIHFWVMFGTLFIPILLFLVGSWPRKGGWRFFWTGLGVSAAIVFGLWLLSYAAGGVMLALPQRAAELVGLQGGVEPGTILMGSLARRLTFPGMWLSLLGILTLAFGHVTALFNKAEETRLPAGDTAVNAVSQELDAARGFILLLLLVGCGLVLFPEFFYLRDQFGWRMNTIFKFYYQAWILLGLAAAYALAWLWQRAAGVKGSRWFPALVMALVVLFFSLLFSFFGIKERLFPAAVVNRIWSLDSANYLRLYQTDLYNAIEWLRTAPAGVVAEAVGGSYQAEYARVATHSGQPAVLGWPGHEGQWRGGYTEIGSREADISELYITSDWEKANEILKRYGIRYIVVGPAEISKYGERVNQEKFVGRLRLVYDSPQVRIYEVSEDLE